jgi:HK97 family phage major capsid protein
MSDRLKALREKRGKIVARMREILDAAKTENRTATDEEIAESDRLFEEQDKVRKQIEAEERQADLDRALAARAEPRETGTASGDTDTPEELALRGFRSWLQTGRVAGAGADEFRALQADTDPSGGYLVAPEQFVRDLIQAVDDMVFIRGLATVIPVPEAQSLGVPSLDADPADADWTSELATGTEDSTMAFGKRELHPRPLAKRIKVSQKLLARSALPTEQIVRERLAYKIGLTEEKAFLTGSGANEPLGLFTASNDGVPTSRDVSTGNTTTSIKVDGLLEAKYALKGQYLADARWLFHRDAVKQISKLVDSNGQYLWQQSVQAGQPDRLLGLPVMMSEYVPNTFTSTLYVGMIAAFRHYWIADALNLQLQRLDELYAETNQVGFIARAEIDGMPVLAEAFARVKLA